MSACYQQVIDLLTRPSTLRERFYLADIIEWRVDAIHGAIEELMSTQFSRVCNLGTPEVVKKPFPIIATWRSHTQGGSIELVDKAPSVHAGTPTQQILSTPVSPLNTASSAIKKYGVKYSDIIEWLALHTCVDIIDVEIIEPHCADLVATVHQGGKQAIASFHQMYPTRISVEEVLDQLDRLQATGADIVKVAYMPACRDDALHVLTATAEYTRKSSTPVISIAMGEHGKITRSFGHLFGSCATFACLSGEPSAPGQIEVSELRDQWEKLRTCGIKSLPASLDKMLHQIDDCDLAEQDARPHL
ncbi:MAG: type I 3-dehydroquinate dehydratase [Actinomycetaceae bacterium]|nr:type I 3-dehydroquinate dehydratase [Actinomycetaceae bacterium]